MLKCKIIIDDMDSMYNNQILSGFEILQREGTLQYEIQENTDSDDNLPFRFKDIEIIVSGKKIVCDMSDGYNNYTSMQALDDALDDVDYYFKSSISDKYNEGMRNRKKFYAMPPRYNVLLPGLPMRKIDFAKIFSRRDVYEIKRLCRKTPFFKTSECHNYIEQFECSPEIHDEPKVFFYTRLWDPNIASPRSSQNIDLNGGTVEQRIESKKEEYSKLSSLRAELVRTLKKEYGSRFIGGIAPDEYSTKTYHELLGNVDMSSRKKYTQHMHKADICVNTRGTHDCWNFSFGEEVAAAKAIVTEKPLYREPLYMEEGINFYTYDNIDNCIKKVNELLEDHDKLQEMKMSNYNYYNNHLRPDCYVRDILRIAGEDV